MDVLSLFHPIIAQWFREQIGEPTDVQTQSWQQISGGGHVLITAPTGSGKTLAAFLWAINQLVTGKLETGYTSVLYISPLRALNNDIQRNLLRPLEELKERFRKAGVPFPNITVETRSGDTPQSDRARMLRHPPEILITTPESLNLLLSSVNGRGVLKNLSTVILDEIHAVLGTKRGVYLMTAIERLVPLSGEFQRIGLSATIKSPELAAKFAGGFKLEGDSKNPNYVPRPVSLVPSQMTRRYDIRVRFPEKSSSVDEESAWAPLVAEFKEIIKRNRSTLIFTNARRLCEKLALAINEGEEAPVAYVHHGSLSREIRAEVERKLRDGELKAVVATNSLELGIDIGALDEVILVQSPPSISSAIQRVGRAGHQVGQVCKGTIFPTHAHDLLEAAVLSPVIISQDMEEIKPINCPLDVLAQVIVSMVGVETWDIDALYAQLLTCYSYRNLSREQFDLALNMLAGRYADSMVRELRPQVSIDRLDNTIAARKGALLTVYTSGGVIPDRGLFHLRHQETDSLIGELDEEFVWEARVGETFSLGAQNWRIERITHNDVFVLLGNPHTMATPFWKGEEGYRDFHFSELIANFLETANERLEEPDFSSALQRENHMEGAAAEGLIAFLKRQKEISGDDLPHRHHILVELVSTGPGGAPGNQLVLHTLWGNQVNRPFAMALDAAFEERYGQRLEVFTSNDCIVLQLPSEIRGEEILSLVSSATVEKLLRKRLESSGFFGARFRESAGRALLLPRNRIGQRMPLWMSRLRSQKLLNAVMRYEDFPILLETWRTCLQDEFDLVSLKQMLAELESGVIRWSEIQTNYVSPMAQHIVWRQTEEYMYMTDEPPGGTISSLRDDLLKHVVFTPDLRPTISPKIVAQFEQKRQRLAPGYSPEEPWELIDWVKERLLIPASEWENLLQAMKRDHNIEPDELPETVAGKLVKLKPPAAAEPLVAAVESLPRIIFGLVAQASPVSVAQASPPVQDFYLTDLYDHPVTQASLPVPDGGLQVLTDVDRDEMLNTLLSEWLQFYGPKDIMSISVALGIDRSELSLALEDLADSQKIVAGQLVTGAGEGQICDSENFEMLLRLARRAAIPAFEAKEIEWLPLFLAHYQGLATLEGDIDALFSRLERLRCLPLPAEHWESEILPARLDNYSPTWLDSIMQEGSLRWVGGEKHATAFCFDAEIELLEFERPGLARQGQALGKNSQSIFPDRLGRYDFSTLLTITGLRPAELSDRLWEGVWQGQVTNDTYAALRKGIATRFAPPRMEPSGHSSRRPGRIGFSRWRASLPFAGNWLLLPEAQPAEDLIESEERMKDRARILLDRYGILFRELLEREFPLFRWGKVFRALRLMELSGEVISGYFFNGIPGPQFISPHAFQTLQGRLPEKKIYWLNATDPASVCGVFSVSFSGPVSRHGINLTGESGNLEKQPRLPKRIPGNHLVYYGMKLVVISQRNGNSLTFNVTPDDPHIQEYLGFLRHLLTRQFQPLRRIKIETINGEPAPESLYLDALKLSFDAMVQSDEVILYRRMG